MKTIRIAFAAEDWRRIHEAVGGLIGQADAVSELGGYPNGKAVRPLRAIQDRIAEALEAKADTRPASPADVIHG